MGRFVKLDARTGNIIMPHVMSTVGSVDDSETPCPRAVGMIRTSPYVYLKSGRLH